jgi:hypothetical protein
MIRVVRWIGQLGEFLSEHVDLLISQQSDPGKITALPIGRDLLVAQAKRHQLIR